MESGAPAGDENRGGDRDDVGEAVGVDEERAELEAVARWAWDVGHGGGQTLWKQASPRAHDREPRLSGRPAGGAPPTKSRRLNRGPAGPHANAKCSRISVGSAPTAALDRVRDGDHLRAPLTPTAKIGGFEK
jgi:hypothetical protein